MGEGMKKIKARFISYTQRLDDIYYYRLLRRFYDIEICDRPDFLFVGQLGYEHFVYDNCVKIITIGENCTPDFNNFDYAIGCDKLAFGDRYLQLPAWRANPHLPELKTVAPPLDETLLKRDFCSFVVSNAGADSLRIDFFNELSKYRKVASGGRLLNNVGGSVKDKMDFIARYKFNIAFENSTLPGYATEKIIEPLAAYTVPIYYGDPDIGDWFSTDCMVRLRSHADVRRAVDEIVALDRDDAAYLAKVKAPRLMGDFSLESFEQRIVEFLRHICDQSPGEARRTCDCGFQTNLRHEQWRLWNFYNKLHPFKSRKVLRKRTRCE